MSAVKVALQHAQKSGRRKNSEAMSVEVSPDSKCPICLDVFHNISYLDRCLHKFCFRCILEWSKNKAECPLCKQPFTSIYHSIKSEQDFQKYELKQQVENTSFGYFEGVRFRYRTTLTGVHRQMRGRTSPPPDNGVMFEASANPPLQRQDRYIRRMMARLAARRRAESEGRTVNNVREQEMINFRRELYRQGVKVRSVRDGGRSRDTSAEFYRRNPACLHRLVPWLKRELTVLYGAHGSLVNIVQHIIMSRITRYDMEDGAIQEELRPFLQARTEHFLHEFISFAKSPFNMEAYDQHAVYDCPAPSSNEDSNSNSSVIAISEEDENLVEIEQPGGSASSLSQSVWDDETPGPSYSTTADPGRISHLSVHDSDSESSSEGDVQEFRPPQPQVSPSIQIDMTQENCNDEDCPSSDSDDCVIIGFVKPTKERTPEVVQLSSDSDESSGEDVKAAPLQPKHIRFPSRSPAASPMSECSGSRGARNPRNDQHPNGNEESGSSKSSKSKKSHRKETDRRRYKSKDKEHRRQRGRSKSGEYRQSSRSPDISHSHSINGSYSYASKDFPKHDRRHKVRGSDSYSYNHHRHETDCPRKHASYHSSQKHTRSRSRSPSRETRRRDRRRTRSRTSSSSCSPSSRRNTHHEKPSGKRKYKTRHLEEPDGQRHHSQDEEGGSVSATHQKKSKERRRKKSKERQRRNSSSVESKEHQQRKHHKKRKHKKKSSRQRSDEHKKTCLPSVVAIVSKDESFANNRQMCSTDEDKDLDCID
ncbi:topoisomerase I binding, arginine/serine-rich a [Oryzias melastigma]|uniref:E3 ubiquitin-protein ligase Topors n=1 Tax=Oryzias melastigma TaxID=30732 RepID=A0A3B3D7W0_ORYME|nr:topoisomerase I binding, arginine/serine-rich a [Oryzias melastigma]